MTSYTKPEVHAALQRRQRKTETQPPVSVIEKVAVPEKCVHRNTELFTARCYASAVLAMGMCPSVSVCLSQVGVLLKRLDVGSHKQHHMIAQGLSFSDAKDLREIRPGSPPAGAPNAGRVGQNWRLSTSYSLCGTCTDHHADTLHRSIHRIHPLALGPTMPTHCGIVSTRSCSK